MPPDQDPLELMRLQITQSMIEHELVADALRMQSIASGAFVSILGLLIFFLWKRWRYSSEALLEQTKRHSAELLRMQERHSLELSSTLMQLLHAFEGMVSRKPRG